MKLLSSLNIDIDGPKNAVAQTPTKLVGESKMRISFHILFSLVFATKICDAQQVVRTGEMVVPRSFHTTTLLKDGRALAIGGITGNSGVGTKSAEVYDPTNGTWRQVGDTLDGRFFPLAVTLHDGRVLIAGGSSLELFDSTTETFSPAGSVSGSISAALLLPDGRVFLVGESGNSALYDPVAGVTATLDSVEVGVPIVLPDGRLVVIGSSSAWIYELKETSLKLLFRHDLGGTLYQRGAALLRDGDILIAGGGLRPFNGPPSGEAILYDPRRGTVRSAGSLPEAQMLYGITSLSDGSALTSGGFDVYWLDSNYYASPARYDPSSEQFTLVPVPVTYTAKQLQDGRALFSGADMYTLQGPTAFLYSPAPRVVSSASRSSSVAPGSLATLFGVGLSTETAAAGTTAFPITLGGTSLTIIDSAGTARLVDVLYVSPVQITFVVPADFQPGKLSLTVQRGDDHQIRASADARVVAPALFAYEDNLALAYALRVEPDGRQTVLSVREPIVLDDQPVYLVLYATGIRNRSSIANVQCTIGVTSLPVEYAGPNGSGMLGLDQVNILLTWRSANGNTTGLSC
jgi:uncharacterized protein (TIGR03437 family)